MTQPPTESLFDGRTATEHAASAAGAVRAINHITIGGSAGLARPVDAYEVLGSLATMASRLPQACDQLATQLATWQAAGEIGIDPGTRYAGDPAAAVADATAGLADAAAAADSLRLALNRAASALCFAHHVEPEAAASFTCPRCGRTSYHPEDARQGYCGACHEFTGARR